MVDSLHLVGSSKLGGAERFVLRLVRALCDAGHDARLVIKRGSQLAEVVAPPALAELSFRNVRDPLARWETRRAIRRTDAAIVQTYLGRATRLTRLPLGGRPLHIARLGGYYKLDGYRHAHAWIGNTRGICDYLVRNGFPASRVHQIGNFVELPQTSSAEVLQQLRAQWTSDPTALLLVAVGRLVPVKGLDQLLTAFARLPAVLEGRPLELLLVGDGPLREPLQQQAEALGVAERVRWTGWQTQPDPFYELADLVVFPSQERETFGNVIIESWAHRKPLVTSLSRGAQELTRHGETAWQVPCGDAAALADGILELLRDPGLRAGLAERGHAQLLVHHTEAQIIGQYLDLYQKLAGGG